MRIGWVAHSPKGWGLAAQLNGLLPFSCLQHCGWGERYICLECIQFLLFYIPSPKAYPYFLNSFPNNFHLAKLFYKSAWNKSTISVFHVGQRVRFLVHKLRWGLKVRALVFQTQWDTSGWSSGLHTADVSDSFSSLGVHTAHHRVSPCHRQGLLS